MKKWNVLAEYDSDARDKQNKQTGVVDLLLANKGIVAQEDKEKFLNPPPILSLIKNFPQDFKSSLRKAKEIILQAIEINTPIVIHGDYDADGICSTAILYKIIKNELNYKNCFYFIPNRFEHGYGLSNDSIDDAVKMVNEKLDGLGKKSDKILFITVDSGITAAPQVDYIKTLGHDVIITDHHQKPDVLPKADCLIWDDEVVAASISWILGRVLGSKDQKTLGLCALATVTDLQPLRSYNRSIVKEGLEVLNKNPVLGIKKLMEVSGRSGGDITTYDLGWVLGPRLNASGRLEEAANALELLLENDENKALQIAQNLNQINSQRQDRTIEMFEIASIDENAAVPKIIISANENYHEGIIGLVAAKLAQKYYRPAVVISLSDKYGKGSVRSIKGIDVISLLRRFEDLFLNLGGHPLAAGFTILKENLQALESKLYEALDEFEDTSLFFPGLEIDLKILLSLVDVGFVKQIEVLKPFGIENREPLFLSTNVGVTSINLVGKEQKHLSLRLFGEGKVYKAIFFNGVDEIDNLNTGDKVDVVYSVKTNEFNGNINVELIIKDLVKL